MVKDFTRSITHWSYKNPDKLKKYYHLVGKKIYVKPSRFDENYIKGKYSDFIYYDENFLFSKTGDWIVPVMSGGIPFMLALCLLFILDKPLSKPGLFIVVL